MHACIQSACAAKIHYCLCLIIQFAALLQDTFCLYAFALCVQLLIHIPYFLKAAAFKQTPGAVLLKIADILLLAAPVGVPTVMLLIGRVGYIRLATEQIALLFPEALKVGALADVVCFDKTGTLTHSVVGPVPCLPICSCHELHSKSFTTCGCLCAMQYVAQHDPMHTAAAWILLIIVMPTVVHGVAIHGCTMQAELHGVLPVHKGEFQLLQKSALHWSNRLKQAVAVCNSLNMVTKNTVAGVDMERAMFKAVEAHFLVSNSRFL